MAVSGNIVRCGYHPKLLLVSLPQLIEGAIEIIRNGHNRFSYDFPSDLATHPLYLNYCREKTIGYHSIAHVRCVALHHSLMRWTDAESMGHIRSDIQYLFLGRFGVNTTLGVAVNISYQEHSWKEGEAVFDNVEDIDLLREEYRLLCRNTRS
jgi:hypothetical protein